MNYKYSFNDTLKKEKFGVKMAKYGETKSMSFLLEECEEGHLEEFVNKKSTFAWFIVEGSGMFVIDDEKISVKKMDIIVVPPKKRIHYFGKMKMLLVNNPPWRKEDESHVRNVDIKEKPNLST